MNGYYLYCIAPGCGNYVGGGDCGCGWRNDYPEDRKQGMEDVSTEDLIQELSSRLFHLDPDEFEDVLDKLRSAYVQE